LSEDAGDTGDRPPSRVGIIVAIVAVVGLAAALLGVAVERDRAGGRPNSVANCDTPPGLK
jgi:hypothetical protein